MTIVIDAAVEQAKTELAKHKHSPTKGAVTMAKRGLNAAKAHTTISDAATAAGRKIASGQQLSDDQVRTMASYHASHDYNCGTDENSSGDVEDMLWGGAPGAAWSAARSAAIDVTSLSETPVELGADDDLSLEIFIRDSFGEKIELDTDENGLIWAPILRSGTHATRPGPFGEKLKEPLVIVPGRASNPGEIGLENLLDNFNRGAVQHVTIPTTHENGVLENNGYIAALKIVDSTARPGERVLMGGHDITEPDVKGRLNRGSVANRSCGILHGYVNTETGEEFDQVLEHVALTNKPWIRGMAPYGELAAADGGPDLSAREIVPMTLSEVPRPKPAPRKLVEPSEFPKTGAVSTRMTESERAAALFADVQWGDVPSFNTIRSQILSQLDGYRGREELGSAPYFYVMDVTSDKALVRIEYGDPDGADDAWVVPYTADSEGVTLAAFDQWAPVQQAWITDDDADRDKQELGSILGAGGMPVPDPTALSEAQTTLDVSQADRDKAHKAGNSLPDKSYPINNVKQLRAAAVLAASGHGDVKAAQALIRRRAKELGVDVTTLPGFGSTKTSETRLLLPPERDNQQGGAMLLTPQEVLDRLGLSDDDKAALQQIIAPLVQSNEQMRTQLAESRKEERKTRVAARVADLQGKGFPSGLLVAYEEIALADDGAVAAVLNLSENGMAPRAVEHTATQLAERLINAIPLSADGKGLEGIPNLVTDPLAGRPPLDGEDAAATRGDGKPKNGVELAEQWAKDAPELATKLGDIIAAKK